MLLTCDVNLNVNILCEQSGMRGDETIIASGVVEGIKKCQNKYTQSCFTLHSVFDSELV